MEELPARIGVAAGRLQVVRSDSLFHYSDNTVILTDVIDFEIREDYMYATKSVVRFPLVTRNYLYCIAMTLVQTDSE